MLHSRRRGRAPARSHSCAMSFTNEMRVATPAWAAYLLIPADGTVQDGDRGPTPDEGLTQVPENLPRKIRIHAEHDPIGLHEVVPPGGPFLKELGIGADVDGEVGVGLDLGPDQVGGPTATIRIRTSKTLLGKGRGRRGSGQRGRGAETG